MDSSVALRQAGLRVTAQRRVVLGALQGAAHATAAQIASRIAALPVGAFSEVSRQGLYNVLEDLTRVGLVRCIEPAGSATRYELRTGDNHHHLVCRACGRIEDIACAVGQAPCLDLPDGKGFTIEEAEITWWGECMQCTAASPLPTEEGDSA
ncbi:MAG TPA: transcriptional repressor [Jatrophihabitans sp.]|jgi:Fur family ferric uptake transcriptional regulator|uniref:Fur family transcriptional regulator n=1 Tax=Jatrophihabitans sp. TaxID=1932789 RepID=UPI002EF1E210